MTRAELIEMVQFRLAGGNTTPHNKGKYHDEIVAAFIARVFEQIIYQVFVKDRRNLDLYAYWYDGIPVIYDNTRHIYTSTLPNSIIPLPDDAGIRRIIPDRLHNGDMNNSFVPIKIGAEEAYNNLEASKITDKMQYRLIGNIIEYPNFNTNISHVSILQIVPFDKLLDYDEIYLPNGQELVLIDMVYQLMFPRVLEEKNDVK